MSTIVKYPTVSPRVEGVGKVFSKRGRPDVVLRDCSFTIETGLLTVLIGPSGCGKSTIANLFAGYDRPSVGTVRSADAVVTGPGPDRIVVFQEAALFPWMSLIDNVAFGPIQTGVPAKTANEQAKDLLRTVGLAGFEDRYPAQVSGGMQRRAEVARAIINKPKLLIMDEPFRGLDHMSRGLMQEYFVRLHEEHRITTLFITSEVEEALFLADRLIVLSYKPTHVTRVIDVDLPRPRGFQILTTQRYGELKEQVLEILNVEAGRAFGRITPTVTGPGHRGADHV